MAGSRRLLWSLLLALGGIAALLAWAAAQRLFAVDPATARLLGAAGLGAPLLAVLVARLLERRLLQPPHALARALELHLEGGGGDPLPAAADTLLAPLLPPLHQLLARLGELEGRLEGERAEATRVLERERRRLAAILRDLAEGLLCCGADGRIQLYNDAAREILGAPPGLGLGRPYHLVLDRLALDHHWRLLRDAAATESEGAPISRPFLCSTTDGTRILRCRLSLFQGEAEEPAGFVLVFEDASRRLAGTDAERFLEEMGHAWRGPLASLRAAAEILAGASDRERAGFLHVLEEESARLEGILTTLSERARQFVIAQWPLSDLALADLVVLLRERLAERDLAFELVDRTGGVWCSGDSFLLGQCLLAFLEALARDFDIRRGELVATAGEEAVALELRWTGGVPDREWFRAWLDGPLFGDRGQFTPREILLRHGARPWLVPDEEGGCLHLDLPPATGLHPVARRPGLPSRPEFYDFDLPLPEEEPADLLDRPLSRLVAVAFDLETTGLDPKRDEIVQIGAVRILGGRLLRGEIFDQLVDPGRPIPAGSTRFHGITDPMVEDAPPPAIALARFKTFVGEAILVAHNAAFDLAFLRRKEELAGVRFDNPVLDTLLLSAVLDPEIGDHSLDAAAARHGITVRARHTALGDAVATAELFLALVPRLRRRGIESLGEALAACRREARRRQRIVGAGAGTDDE